MPRKKIIGLTGPSSFSDQCMMMIEKFFDANFVLLYQTDVDNLNHWVSEVDGVILAGGIDIHPIFYNQSVKNCQNLSKFDLTRDQREFQVIDACLNRGKPILGICRGHQMLGVYHNMKFKMDISDSITCHNPRSSNVNVSGREPAHYVDLVDAGIYFSEGGYGAPQIPDEFKLLKKKPMHLDERIWVNSFHHQAVEYHEGDKAAKFYQDRNIRVLGVASAEGYGSSTKSDKIIEFMDGPNWLSVQWHPEYDWMDNTPSRVVLNRFKTILGAKS